MNNSNTIRFLFLLKSRWKESNWDSFWPPKSSVVMGKLMLQPSWCPITAEQFPVPFQHSYCKDLKALFRAYLEIVKSCQGRKKRIFLSLDHCGLYKSALQDMGKMVKIFLILQGKYWVVFVFSAREKQRQSFPFSVSSGIERSSRVP